MFLIITKSCRCFLCLSMLSGSVWFPDSKMAMSEDSFPRNSQVLIFNCRDCATGNCKGLQEGNQFRSGIVLRVRDRVWLASCADRRWDNDSLVNTHLEIVVSDDSGSDYNCYSLRSLLYSSRLYPSQQAWVPSAAGIDFIELRSEKLSGTSIKSVTVQLPEIASPPIDMPKSANVVSANVLQHLGGLINSKVFGIEEYESGDEIFFFESTDLANHDDHHAQLKDMLVIGTKLGYYVGQGCKVALNDGDFLGLTTTLPFKSNLSDRAVWTENGIFEFLDSQIPYKPKSEFDLEFLSK